MLKNNLHTIYNEMTGEQKDLFVSSCAAKLTSNFGVPRITLIQDETITEISLKKLFNTNIDIFKKNDTRYFPYIDVDLVESFLDSMQYRVVFDKCRYTFIEHDDLYEAIDNDLRKLFNLKNRNDERRNFYESNHKHLFDKHSIASEVILIKLNSIWQSKWGDNNIYLNDYNELILNNIIDV